MSRPTIVAIKPRSQQQELVEVPVEEPAAERPFLFQAIGSVRSPKRCPKTETVAPKIEQQKYLTRHISPFFQN